MQILRILGNNILLIIIFCLIGGVSSYFYTTNYVEPTFTAYISLYVYNDTNGKETTINDINIASKLVDTYVVILKSNSVLQEVADQSGINCTVSQLKSMISAASVNDTEVFNVYVTATDPEVARIIAQTISEVAPAEIIRVVKAGSVEIIDPPQQNPPQTSPNLMKNTLIGIFLGAALSVGIATLRWVLDKSVKDENGLAEAFEYPILGSIPKFDSMKPKGDKYGKETHPLA